MIAVNQEPAAHGRRRQHSAAEAPVRDSLSPELDRFIDWLAERAAMDYATEAGLMPSEDIDTGRYSRRQFDTSGDLSSEQAGKCEGARNS